MVQEGDVLFCPGGTPHFVENITDSIAYAGNFVDHSNLEGALRHMKRAGGHVFDALNEIEFDTDEEIFPCISRKAGSWDLSDMVVSIDFLHMSHSLQRTSQGSKQVLNVDSETSHGWWDSRYMLPASNDSVDDDIESQETLDKLSPTGIAAAQVVYQADSLAAKLWDQGLNKVCSSYIYVWLTLVLQ